MNVQIDSVDFFYLAMPVVRDVGDGSQDALLVRVEANGTVGWGECEAAPLPSIAAWCCPMSHSACKPVRDSVLGQRLDGPNDIRRINAAVRANSFDLLQADHTLSGVDVALWDLLGRRMSVPVHCLLGQSRSLPKIAYASQLFGDEPSETYRRALKTARLGYRAAKFGWGPYGRSSIEADAEQVRAAREGLGPGILLMVDAGTVWGDDVDAAAARLPALEEARVTWLEEPFVSGALNAYRRLADLGSKVPLAAGEGCHDFHQAKNMIDYAGIQYVQIDTGRIGGITTAAKVAEYARARGVSYVNHTFTTQLALSASLQPYAGISNDELCEFPAEPSPLARDFCRSSLALDQRGCVRVPDAPGLGLEPDWRMLRRYLLDVRITLNGRELYGTPAAPRED